MAVKWIFGFCKKLLMTKLNKYASIFLSPYVSPCISLRKYCKQESFLQKKVLGFKDITERCFAGLCGATKGRD
jgi:hypothetical protein